MLILLLTLVAALGSALVGGVFFAFSSFVMRALARVPAGCGMAVMQSINVVVLNRSFLGVFLGTAVPCAGLVVVVLLRPDQPGAVPLLVGAALYLLGSLLVTIAFNVPRNEALAALDPEDARSVPAWERYLSSWTGWNHVRTLASMGAAASFCLALAA